MIRTIDTEKLSSIQSLTFFVEIESQGLSEVTLVVGAQLSWLERYLDMVEVVGSNPIAPTNNDYKVFLDYKDTSKTCGPWYKPPLEN